jgi:hypothetical protein
VLSTLSYPYIDTSMRHGGIWKCGELTTNARWEDELVAASSGVHRKIVQRGDGHHHSLGTTCARVREVHIERTDVYQTEKIACTCRGILVSFCSDQSEDSQTPNMFQPAQLNGTRRLRNAHATERRILEGKT